MQTLEELNRLKLNDYSSPEDHLVLTDLRGGPKAMKIIFRLIVNWKGLN